MDGVGTGVTNVSSRLQEGEWAPECVISTKGAAGVIWRQRYVDEQQFGPVTILARADVVREQHCVRATRRMPQYTFLAGGVPGYIMRQYYIVTMEYLRSREPADSASIWIWIITAYPVSALFREMAGGMLRLGHIDVTNVSGFCNISWVVRPILSLRLPRRAATLQSGFGIAARPTLGKSGTRPAGCTRTLLAQNRMLAAVKAILAIPMRLLIYCVTDTLQRIRQRFRPSAAGFAFDFLYYTQRRRAILAQSQSRRCRINAAQLFRPADVAIRI